MDKKEIVFELGSVVLGNLIVALGVTFFILPSDILCGGTAGIAVALQPIFHLPETLVINALTVLLFLIGSICLGKAFFFKTVLSTVVYPIFISILNTWFADVSVTQNQLLAAIYAGICIGTGIGLVYRVDGSTGGMDIPPLVIHKYTKLPLSLLIVFFDGATVTLGALVYGIEASMIGLVSVFVSGIVINKVLTLGSEASKTLFIISPKWEAIRDAINKELDRGVTLVPSIGGFSNENCMNSGTRCPRHATREAIRSLWASISRHPLSGVPETRRRFAYLSEVLRRGTARRCAVRREDKKEGTPAVCP